MDVAIVGAGIAGLTAAYELTRLGIDCEVFEKSRALGGRMATRRHEETTFDHGAQYFTVRTPEFAAFLGEIGVADQLLPLAAPVIEYPFDNLDGALAKAAARVAAEVATGRPFPHRYSFVNGMTTLAKSIVARIGDGRVTRECFVDALEWNDATRQWTLHTRGDNTTLGGTRTAKAVILALPAPQVVQLLERSRPLPAEFDGFINAMGRVKFEPCVTFAWCSGEDFHYPGIGALQSNDPAQSIGWLVWIDRLLPGRSGEGQSVMLAQFSPEASGKLLDQPEATVCRVAATILSQTLNIEMPTIRWVQVKQWRYANPVAFFDAPETLLGVAEYGVQACGDYFLKGRVEAAFESGRAVARALAARFRE